VIKRIQCHIIIARHAGFVVCRCRRLFLFYFPLLIGFSCVTDCSGLDTSVKRQWHSSVRDLAQLCGGASLELKSLILARNIRSTVIRARSEAPRHGPTNLGAVSTFFEGPSERPLGLVRAATNTTSLGLVYRVERCHPSFYHVP